MPDKDGRGPAGKGPLTGCGSGYCAIPLNTAEEELDFLKNQEKVLKGQLRIVKARVKALETATRGGKK